MFATNRRCFDFVTFSCQYQVCLKRRKLVYESFSVNENSSAKSKKGVALTSDYICLQKMKKATLLLLPPYLLYRNALSGHIKGVVYYRYQQQTHASVFSYVIDKESVYLKMRMSVN